jgi:hypothetical protein
MTLTDFSFSNTQIKKYFDGSDEYVPVAELLYVHTHPLVKPNFLDQIEALINKTSAWMKTKNMKGQAVTKLTDLSIKLGAELPGITRESAPIILSLLRSIYAVCNALLIGSNIV